MELRRTAAIMITSWASWTHVLEGLSFSDAIYTTFANVARKIVLRQLRNLDHGTLIIHDTDGSKHVFGTTTDSTIGKASTGTAIILEDDQFHRRGSLTVELYIHSSSVWSRILFTNDVGFAEAYAWRSLLL